MLEFRKKSLLRSGLLFLGFLLFIFPFLHPFGLALFVLYGLINWALVYRMARPIQRILDAISMYKEEAPMPQIVLNEGEFSKLASTLNSLNQRVQTQINTEVNQRKETEGILNSLGEGVVAFDPTARATFVNLAARSFLGISQGEPLGESLLARRCHELVLQALQTADRIQSTWTEEGRFYLELSASPLVHQAGALLVLQDKTADRKILTVGKEFIANASHELRTPITVIRGFAETLSDLPKLSPAMLQQITQKIVRTSERLDKLIKSLLLLSDLENTPKGSNASLDLVLLAENCKHLLLASHPEVQCELKSDRDAVYIDADAGLLELSLMNLLENAVRYSNPPIKIEIEIETKDAGISLTVRDQGIGIPESDLPHIFGRFYTVDKARSRKSGGAGLGLSIVKTIVEKHGWKVRAASKLQEGSAFTIEMPR